MPHHRTRVAIATITSSALLLACFATATAVAGGRPLVAQLSGRAVTNGVSLLQGDPDGRGLAVVKRTGLDGSTDEVCWFIVTRDLALPATGGGIFQGAANMAAGIPVVKFSDASVTYPLALPKSVVPINALGRGVGIARGCAEAPDLTLDLIWTHPASYFIELQGAPGTGTAPALSRDIRGQLR